jgi:lipopolysaccharide/colanic/teichoic acid biosynthesis glycosyltransferase
MSPWLRLRVRLDRVVAALLLVPAAPVIGALALLIKRDGGPALIEVPRIGMNGHILPMWKLRSMRADRPGGLSGGADLTARDDDRITPIGRRIRKTHVDELPQLWNIVLGNMALIGARPEAPGYVDLGDDRWKRILSAPPGIMGFTQVLVHRWEAEILLADRSATVYRSTILPLKVALDDLYVRTASPWLDLLVVIGAFTGRDARLRKIAARAVPAFSEVP